MQNPPRVLIIGASVRAAAQSARRAGWDVVASDMFGDADLREIAEFVPIDSYPDGFSRVLQAYDLPVIYTGGLENYPDLLTEASTLWGNFAEPLARVRDPFFWTELFEASGIRTAGLKRHDDQPAVPEAWLVKSFKGAGGGGVRFATTGQGDAGTFLQEFITGQLMSGVFVGTPSSAVLCGVTKQLTRATCDEVPFAYGGTVGPVGLADSCERQICEVGDLLAASAGLRGLFGVDFVLDGTSVVPIEINPRYTASVEVLELASQRSLLAEHKATCCGELVSTVPVVPTCCLAKVILYAASDMTIGVELNRQVLPEYARFADTPLPGTRVPAGRPVCTLLCEGETPGAALDRAENLVPNAFVSHTWLQGLPE